MARQTTIIRMGAAAYDVTITKPNGKVLHWDLRAMPRAARSKWHARFMSEYRRRNPMKPRALAA